MDSRDAERIAQDVMAVHGCHTLILYRSWALLILNLQLEDSDRFPSHSRTIAV